MPLIKIKTFFVYMYCILIVVQLYFQLKKSNKYVHSDKNKI